MADSLVTQTLADTEEYLTEKEKLHSSLSSYDLGTDVKDYEYEDLGVPSADDPDYRDKKRFRLLNLMSGFLDSPTIYCEIFEVEVNIAKDEVHIVQDSDRLTSESITSGTPTKSVSYEALSWRWGNESEDKYAIMIKTSDGERKKRVSETLGLALKYLRYQTKPRMIWIDALCIDQNNFDERSSQVAMMDRLYTGASQICVWLGKDDPDSRKAIKFIKEEINELRDFDKLCKNSKHAEKWRALLGLMQRDWFSRRWVVQELALARKATIYCGPDKIEWRELAIAIELFVEVESATHRLSELMKKDDRFNVIPNWFEHISELGASLLVTETSKIFRDYKRESDKRPLGLGHLSPTGPGRRSLLSLEYLVTSLSIFDCGRPHDYVYALVAISRDAFPSPPTSITQRSKEALVTEVMKGFVERKPFPLDYDIPYPDVARDFIEFTIQRHVDTGKDEEKALDILCRPWSKDWRLEDDESHEEKPEGPRKKRLFGCREIDWKWKILREEDREKFRFSHAPLHERAENDDKTMEQWRVKAKAQGGEIISEDAYKKKWAPWFEKKKPKLQSDGKSSVGSGVQPTTDTAMAAKTKAQDAHLPSWVSNVTRAPFDIFPHPGVEMTKMGRKNADPLVGSLDNGRGTYSAAQSKKQNSYEIKFRKRARLNHYSLYVRGFRFDKVDIVEQVSQQGAIPASWLRLGEWEKAIRPRTPGADPGIPPDALWRTLVADRGMHNQNPPYYYSRACRETIMKGALRSNAVDTTALIYNERNSIIAEFCRRTQCVIWNRAMIKTQNGHLGLVSPDVRKGDLVCIIYGCTVPVILRKAEMLKTGKNLKDEMKDDCLEAFRRAFKHCLQRRARKFEYAKQSDEHKKQVEDDLNHWKAKLRAQTMLEKGIEKPDIVIWERENQVEDGESNEGGHQAKEDEVRHPWQTQCDRLAEEMDALEKSAKVALLNWKTRSNVKKNQVIKEWLRTAPSKVNKVTVNSWVEKMPGELQPVPYSIRIWQWLGRMNRLEPDKIEISAAKEWIRWRDEEPKDAMSDVADGKEKPARIDFEQLEQDIKRWDGVKSFLDKVVTFREGQLASHQRDNMEEELKSWRRSQIKTESGNDCKAQTTKRWRQISSKTASQLKSTVQTSPASGHFSSDEESDEDSEEETKGWGVNGIEVGQEQSDSDSDSDSDGIETAEGHEKQANFKKRLEKKKRQSLADERDPFRHYKFLGEAYIHGMMEGEAVSQSFYKKKPEHLFEIR
ncbi:hypothetical protein N0V93_005971 [Gnomoniopsis smithogilvyi]|uniref:Heterokaryon incompatibility domain-containing protein n=1 Tax=Gnomoniopsis smithogilvyi TaxID=1191159 RepID=A0A9W9CYI9_9PEZI|nr:hypothetical protein N0V93_005971 [Gnomoniopsis smithogilvyi]